MSRMHFDSSLHHLQWDRALRPIATIAPGEEITLDLMDASGGQLHRTDADAAVNGLDFASVNPCTGPIFVEGVRPGDELIVSILDVALGECAWTANIPGFGLLHDDFPLPRLWISSVHDGIVTTPIGVELPVRAMVGTIGLAPDQLEPSSLLVPTAAGGNMDIAQLGVGSTVHFKSQLAGAMLSAGDTHALQGDGEVCGTGAEIASTLLVRVEIGGPTSMNTPWFEHTATPITSKWKSTTGVSPDLFEASREATRRAIDLLSARSGLDPVDCYLLLSLVGELRISEIVDAPNWVVSMHFPSSLVGN